jgi:hypothetical protein
MDVNPPLLLQTGHETAAGLRATRTTAVLDLNSSIGQVRLMYIERGTR